MYCAICLSMYRKRTKSVILVDFDSTLSDVSAIVNRGNIYTKNHPNKDINDYITAHISEQEPIPKGISKVWVLQRQCYKIVFISGYSENCRLDIARFLNKWGLVGELHMDSFPVHGVSRVADKLWTISQLEKSGLKVVGIIDNSQDVNGIIENKKGIKRF